MDNVAIDGMCPNCGERLSVLPSSVLAAVEAIGGPEDELDFATTLPLVRSSTGRAMALAGVRGDFRCPVCGDSTNAADLTS